jgi:hypothetical protein
MLDCTTCERRHKAQEEGFCSEFTVMPQLDKCAMHLSSKTTIGGVPVVSKPSGTYLHLPKGDENKTTGKTV